MLLNGVLRKFRAPMSNEPLEGGQSIGFFSFDA